MKDVKNVQKTCAIRKFFTEKVCHNVNMDMYVFNEEVNCKSSNIVNGIKCEKCDRIYTLEKMVLNYMKDYKIIFRI